ncbi:hypothetical protein A3A01_01475 [Candidatus Nomurabacteria bacterium RIFCSPLOWO2_01_FULL_39_17]|uniref:Reverse transcriptase domain-containing protein n=1 Tax=Candidatus Nomurabacteria bacterium RIFCSPLOWO2_01_FULL_39_17 TaxID=1801770 RepID=A0A1F6WXE1_9BACT|nr:MAG: hypothetical protein A3A01_01475 [Candidatus Nomurabacteria bacterium RIFCSPLOWO2_01_FULL_39_17]
MALWGGPDDMKRFIHTYDNIITIEKLLKAWQEFLCDKKGRIDVNLFQAKLMDNVLDLFYDLKNKTYKHGHYTAFNISDPKPRQIHKATIRDRLLHHLIYQELYEYFDNKFIYDSYSCRVNKGTHKAIDRFRKFAYQVSKNHTRTAWVLKCDIKKFFANIDHKILKTILSKGVFDNDILWLLGEVIDSFSSKPNFTEVGLPLGNLTSQLLVNIFMNEFDQFMKRKLKVKYYIRYADDFVILSDDTNYLKELLPKISNFLEEELNLQLHPSKVFLKTIASGVDFLGWVHFPHHRVLRTSTKRRMIKKLKGNYNNAQVLQSYLGLISHGNTHKLKNGLVDNHF